MNTIDMLVLYDRVKTEFSALLLDIHDMPLDAETRALLNAKLIDALDHASASSQLAAIAHVRDLSRNMTME